MRYDIVIKPLWTNQLIPASGSITSDPVDLGDLAQLGNFSLHLEITSTGATIDASYLVSNSSQATTFTTPLGASDIVIDFWEYSGGSSNGIDVIPFDVIFARYLKIKLTEVGGATGATVTAKLAVQ
jgi:hypothetical protein